MIPSTSWCHNSRIRTSDDDYQQQEPQQKRHQYTVNESYRASSSNYFSAAAAGATLTPSSIFASEAALHPSPSPSRPLSAGPQLHQPLELVTYHHSHLCQHHPTHVTSGCGESTTRVTGAQEEARLSHQHRTSTVVCIADLAAISPYSVHHHHYHQPLVDDSYRRHCHRQYCEHLSFLLPTNTNNKIIMSSPIASDTKIDGGDSVVAGGDLDVAVVQPSFDEGQHDARSPSASKRAADADGGSDSRRGHHVRNLSAHFEDATKNNTSPGGITNETRNNGRLVMTKAPDDNERTSRATSTIGQKHRRMYSEDASNTAKAHRRIDSLGPSAGISKRDHRRIDSSGLEALSAAADYQKELAAVPKPWETSVQLPAGAGPHHDVTTPIHPPLAHPRHYTGPPPGSTFYGYSPSHNPPYHASYGPPPAASYYAHPPTSHNVYPPPPSHHVAYHPSVPHHHAYPVQYARGGTGSDQYGNPPQQLLPLQQAYLEKPSNDGAAPAAVATTNPDRNDKETSTEEAAAKATTSTATNTTPTKKDQDGFNNTMSPPVPVNKGSLRFMNGGSTQGVQTYVTAISVGDSGRTVHPSGFPMDRPAFGHHRPMSSIGDASILATGSVAGHHRKMSSFSALAPILFGDTSEHPLKRGASGTFGTSRGPHHRQSSSTVSFLNSLEVTLDGSDAAFMRNLQAQTGAAPGGLPPSYYGSAAMGAPKGSTAQATTPNPAGAPLATGGTSKRIRRKCTIEGCENRVVQGGLCIAHGAKRKICRHPGCTKHVKKAGLCSTHGPARKRCDTEGCTKVAVQGGKCIAHGAKKKLCVVSDCKKQAILGGMCKKHHDQNQQHMGGNFCEVTEPKEAKSKSSKKPAHQRGLSIFQEISADTVGDLLSADDAPIAPRPSPPAESSSSVDPGARSHHHQSTFSQQIEKIIDL